MNYYESEVSTYDYQIAEDFDDEVSKLMDNSYSGGFCNYNEFYKELNSNLPLNSSNFIRKYLAYMVRADWDEVDKMKEKTIGKNIGEFNIPVCDTEAEYLEKCKLSEEEYE